MRKKKWVITYLPPLALGLLLLLVPLLRDVHLESALFTSIVMCFWGGWKSVRVKQQNYSSLIRKGIFSVFLIFAPLFFHGLISDCITLDGLLIWALLPVPSLMFGISIGRFFSMIKIPYPTFFTVLTLLIIALGVWLFEFFRLPQVYYFNHVWGYWPGPIYDDEIRVTSALIWFRSSTLLWALLLWTLPSFSKSMFHKVALISTSVVVLAILFFQPNLGISTPRSELQHQLSEQKVTDHFVLYYESEFYSADEIDYWANRHEFHFKQIIEQLEIDWPVDRKIESYLYNHAWHKKELVGAKFTSYVPVWLEQDQLHIAKEHLDGVLKHELVHVIAKQFGNGLMNASWSIGLVEGVAEAIAKDASDVSTLHQIIAAEQPLPSADQMESALSVLGFYGSASAISYTTSGSFVRYLLNNYPVQQFKNAYPNSDFESAYALPFDTLVTRWKAQLPVEEVDSLDQEVSQYIFSQQSLFQVSCPRKAHPIIQGLDEFQFHEANLDPEKALAVTQELYQSYPDMNAIKQLWAKYTLLDGNPLEVIEGVTATDSIPSLHLYKADATFITDGYTSAASYLREIRTAFLNKNDVMLTQSFEVRSDSTNWQIFINARYDQQTAMLEGFASLPEPLIWLLVDRALLNMDELAIIEYARALIQQKTNPTWFDTQERLINLLVYYNEAELAQLWIDRLKSLPLRERYLERILELEQWADFNIGD